jgi:hypothetical protein
MIRLSMVFTSALALLAASLAAAPINLSGTWQPNGCASLRMPASRRRIRTQPS